MTDCGEMSVSKLKKKDISAIAGFIFIFVEYFSISLHVKGLV